MVETGSPSDNEILISPPPRAALSDRLHVSEDEAREFTRVARRVDDPARDDHESHRQHFFSKPRSWSQVEWPLDDLSFDFSLEEHGAGSNADDQPDAVVRQPGNIPKGQKVASSRSGLSSGASKVKNTASSKARSLVSVGRSKKHSTSKSSAMNKRESPTGPRAADEQALLDDGLTDIDKAVRSARDDIAVMQLELEKYRHQDMISMEAPSETRKITAQESLTDQLAEVTRAKTRLEETVAQLRSDLQAERTEKTFWQDKHEEFQEKYLRAESEVRILRANMIERDSMWKREWERKNEHILLERDRCQDGYHSAQKALREREEEVQELRRHILGLKHNISTWTKIEGQVSDDVFTERIRSLGHDLQNWTINHFRRAKKSTIVPGVLALFKTDSVAVDRASLSESTQLELDSLLPAFDQMMQTTSVVNLIQSVIATILVHDVFSAYYFGLDEESMMHLRSVEQSLNTMAPPAKVNEWRSTTLGIIRQHGAETYRVHVIGLSRSLHVRINNIVDELTSSTATSARNKGLQSILDQAIELSQAFRVQRAQLQVHMPVITIDHSLGFDLDTMEDITGEDDEENLADSVVECVIFPYVIKLGDETGDNTHLRNVLVKAKLCCRRNT